MNKNHDTAHGERLLHAYRLGFAKAYCGYDCTLPGSVRTMAEADAFLSGFRAGGREARSDAERLVAFRSARASA